MNEIILLLQLLTIGVIAWLSRSFFPKYFEKKAENLATKEDIEEITKKVESVKADVSRTQSVFQAKYQLKHDACLVALGLVDAHFSHTLVNPGGPAATRQYATAKEARECHNKLILSCENPEILIVFSELMFGPRGTESASAPPTDVLNKFRNLVRAELGFGGEMPLDRERAWFGKVVFEPEKDSEGGIA